MDEDSEIYQIIKYSPIYKTGILNLLLGMWKDYDDADKLKLFKWRYEDNPYEEPIIYVAINNEKVIGFRSFISQKFLKGNKEYLVFSPSDTIIHLDFRRRGIISALNEKCIVELNRIYNNQNIILINTSTSKPSMPVYLKQQWQKSNGLRYFYIKLSILNYIQNKTSHYDHTSLKNTIVLTKNTYTIEITPEVKCAELSSFNSKIRNTSRWTNIRDEKFFRWRYSFQPEKYCCVYCYKNSELQGYMVIKELNDVQTSIDQFEAQDNQILKLMLKAASRALKIVQLRSCGFLPEEKKLLKGNGFFAEPVTVLKILGRLRFPVLVRPMIMYPENKDFIIDGCDIRDINNWHLQISDRH